MAEKQTQKTERSRFQIFVQVWAGFGLLLFVLTWKLWTPQTDFPQIPFFEFLIDVPGWVDWIALTFVGVSLIACLVSKAPQWTRRALGTFALASFVLIVLNQHRLQPWAYQFVIFAVIMATASPKSAMKWMRWIVISIYVYSAISKFDYQFVHTVGDQMLKTIASFVGMDSTQWPDEIQNAVALSFPLTELAIGVALVFQSTRKIAVFAAVAMHVAILLILISQLHFPGVMIWNLFFIGQAILLFGRNEIEETKTVQEPTGNSLPLSFLATLIAGFVIAFPSTQPLGICDHWPAWQVYAPRTSRARIPQRSKVEPEWNDPAMWSQSELWVPIYPQARFQFAVAMATLEKLPFGDVENIEVHSQSDRLTGDRKSDFLSGDQIKMHAERYRLNVKPRSFWFDDADRRAPDEEINAESAESPKTRREIV